MAVQKQRLYRKNSAGGYDTIRLETGSDVVLRPDGTTVENALTSFGSHKHSASDITSGILPVNRGGTGVSDLSQLRVSLGIENQVGQSYSIGNVGLGSIVKWANREWIVVTLTTTEIMLAARYRIDSDVTVPYSPYSTDYPTGTQQFYPYSNLYKITQEYEKTIPSDSLQLAINTTMTLSGYRENSGKLTSKIFAVDQNSILGQYNAWLSNVIQYFSPMEVSRYGNSNDTRVWTDVNGNGCCYWIADSWGSEPVTTSKSYVGIGGNVLTNINADNSTKCYFRPFVMIKR